MPKRVGLEDLPTVDELEDVLQKRRNEESEYIMDALNEDSEEIYGDKDEFDTTNA